MSKIYFMIIWINMHITILFFSLLYQLLIPFICCCIIHFYIILLYKNATYLQRSVFSYECPVKNIYSILLFIKIRCQPSFSNKDLISLNNFNYFYSIQSCLFNSIWVGRLWSAHAPHLWSTIHWLLQSTCNSITHHDKSRAPNFGRQLRFNYDIRYVCILWIGIVDNYHQGNYVH